MRRARKQIPAARLIAKNNCRINCQAYIEYADLTFSQLVPAVIVSTTDHGNGTATVTVRSSQAVSSSDSQFFRLSATLTQ